MGDGQVDEAVGKHRQERERLVWAKVSRGRRVDTGVWRSGRQGRSPEVLPEIQILLNGEGRSCGRQTPRLSQCPRPEWLS